MKGKNKIPLFEEKRLVFLKSVPPILFIPQLVTAESFVTIFIFLLILRSPDKSKKHFHDAKISFEIIRSTITFNGLQLSLAFSCIFIMSLKVLVPHVFRHYYSQSGLGLCPYCMVQDHLGPCGQ